LRIDATFPGIGDPPLQSPGKVASILNEQMRCLPPAGEVAPFSLETWQQAANWAGAMKDANSQAQNAALESGFPWRVSQ